MNTIIIDEGNYSLNSYLSSYFTAKCTGGMYSKKTSDKPTLNHPQSPTHLGL